MISLIYAAFFTLGAFIEENQSLALKIFLIFMASMMLLSTIILLTKKGLPNELRKELYASNNYRE